MNQKRQTMECRICPIVAIVSLPHIVMPPLLVLLNAAEHAYLLLCFIYCFALLLCFALFIALLIHCRSNKPTDSTTKASTWWWAFSSYTSLSLWGHGWIKMSENEDRVLQKCGPGFLRERKRVRWTDIARGANVIHDRWAGQGFHCPEMEERGNAHRGMQSRSTSDWATKRGRKGNL